jgi:hypothetical protein
MSLLKERILSLKEVSENFFNIYIKNFKSDMSEIKFNKFRLFFLNIIHEVKIYFYI